MIGEARSLLSTTVDAETGERGYLITGDDAYLQPWTGAQAAVPNHLARLKALTADNPGQQLRLGQLDELVSRKFEMIAAAVAARRLGHPAAIEKRVMDRFRTVEAAFEAEELSQFGQRQAALEARWTQIMLASLAIGLGFLAVLVVSARQIRRSETRAAAAEGMARQAQKMEAIGQLTGGIAHDFNNILQVVITNLDLAMGQLGSNQAVTALLHTAMMGLEKGAKLTGQLLSFSRRQPLRPEAVAVSKVMDEAVALLRRTLGERQEIEVVAAGALWRAMIDPQLLVNAIVNLAINARDAMPDGGRLTVEAANVTLDADYAAREGDGVLPGQYVMVAVSDTGCGMPREVLERAFEPFFTTKSEGTGLGLPMVFGFIKQSLGHIKIYSEPGQGTTVKMYLPRTTREETVRAELAERSLRGDGQTILVLEDDDGVRAGVVAQLSDLGYKVVAAAEGVQALEILRKDPSVALLFTDVVLTGTLNGRAVADRARQFRPDLPVIYTSGYTENAIVHHGRLDEGAILLSKPYRTSDLARVVGAVLAGGTPPPAQPNAAAAPRLILLAEDDPHVRLGLVAVLEMFGHRVITAATGAAALAAIDGDAKAADVLITDLGLPDMDGLALAEAVRARLPELDIVIASGSQPSPAALASIPGPPPRCLRKPFSPQDLADSLAGESRKGGTDAMHPARSGLREPPMPCAGRMEP